MVKQKYVYIIAITLGTVCWLCLIAFVIGPATVNCDNFAVDSHGTLYIGRKDSLSKTVFVYQNGTLIRSMPAITNRGYAFTIQADDTMLWATNGTITVTDLYGNNINQEEDELFHTYSKLANNKRFISSNGDIYIKRLGFGTFKIYKNDTIIYEHPSYNQYLLITLIISGIGLLFSVLWIVKKTKKTD